MGMELDRIHYGAVCLVVTDLERAVGFWEKVIGLRVRAADEKRTEMGTEEKTLLVLEAGAVNGFRNGFSGLYHVAVHVPDEATFATVLRRLLACGMNISPVDHIMSKAIYVLEPDGITVEITLETPERFGRYAMDLGRFEVIDADGRVRGGTERLDVNAVLDAYEVGSIDEPLPNSIYVGHVHLYVPDLVESYPFYKRLGFEESLISVEIGFADLSAGGRFKHRIAMNTWQSLGAPQAPEGTAGMRYFTLELKGEEYTRVVGEVDGEESERGYEVVDPGGSRVVLVKR